VDVFSFGVMFKNLSKGPPLPKALAELVRQMQVMAPEKRPTFQVIAELLE
jgi:hypothetical protein